MFGEVKNTEKPVPYQVQQLDIVLKSKNTVTLIVGDKKEKISVKYQVQQLDIVLVSDNEAALIVR